MSFYFSFAPHSWILPYRRTTEGAVGQAIFSPCILSVIMSLIFSERDPPGCSPHPASFTKDTVHMYFSLETTWSITGIYLHSLACEIIFELLFFQNAFAVSTLWQITLTVKNLPSLVINVMLKKIITSLTLVHTVKCF